MYGWVAAQPQCGRRCGLRSIPGNGVRRSVPLNPFGAASVKSTILAASLWQSIALFRLHFNWDSRAIWEGF